METIKENFMIAKNQKKIEELCEEITRLHEKLSILKRELYEQVRIVPDGYKQIFAGEKVEQGAIYLMPGENSWDFACSSVGHILNSAGYVPGHAGYLYANPN